MCVLFLFQSLFSIHTLNIYYIYILTKITDTYECHTLFSKGGKELDFIFRNDFIQNSLVCEYI